MTKKTAKKTSIKEATEFTSIFRKNVKVKSFDEIRSDVQDKLNEKSFHNVSVAVDNALENVLIAIDRLGDNGCVFALDMIIAELIEQRNACESQASKRDETLEIIETRRDNRVDPYIPIYEREETEENQ